MQSFSQKLGAPMVLAATTATLLLFLAASATVSAQFHNGRILEPPVVQQCVHRKIHTRTNDGKGYYMSWRDPTLNKTETEVDWLAARNFCRRMCMDTISIETSAENEWIKDILVKDQVRYIWTSGRMCDFVGCERADLQPLHLKGWFWTATLQKLAPTNERNQNDWSETGGIGKPQPDNRELQQGGATENCLAVLNNFYNDGVHWHDVACHHVKPFVCEESYDLIKYVRYNNPQAGV